MVQQRQRAAVARRAPDIAHQRIPVVAVLVDEPDPQPDRIGEIEARDPARKRRAVEHAVGGKRKCAIGKALPAPAAVGRGIAALRRRIAGVEFGEHQPESFRRQPRFQRAARTIHQEDVVAFLDTRERQCEVCEQAESRHRQRADPSPTIRRNPAGKYEHGRHHEQRKARQVVERKPERRDHERERGELHPGLLARSVQWRGVLVNCVGRGPYRLATVLSNRRSRLCSAARSGDLA